MYVVGATDDGRVEIARFATIEFHPEDDLNTSSRGPIPDLFSPPEKPSDVGQDRIAALEKQVASLVASLSSPSADTPAPDENTPGTAGQAGAPAAGGVSGPGTTTTFGPVTPA